MRHMWDCSFKVLWHKLFRGKITKKKKTLLRTFLPRDFHRLLTHSFVADVTVAEIASQPQRRVIRWTHTHANMCVFSSVFLFYGFRFQAFVQKQRQLDESGADIVLKARRRRRRACDAERACRKWKREEVVGGTRGQIELGVFFGEGGGVGRSRSTPWEWEQSRRSCMGRLFRRCTWLFQGAPLHC